MHGALNGRDTLLGGLPTLKEESLYNFTLRTRSGCFVLTCLSSWEVEATTPVSASEHGFFKKEHDKGSALNALLWSIGSHTVLFDEMYTSRLFNATPQFMDRISKVGPPSLSEISWMTCAIRRQSGFNTSRLAAGRREMCTEGHSIPNSETRLG